MRFFKNLDIFGFYKLFNIFKLSYVKRPTNSIRDFNTEVTTEPGKCEEYSV